MSKKIQREEKKLKEEQKYDSYRSLKKVKPEVIFIKM